MRVVAREIASKKIGTAPQNRCPNPRPQQTRSRRATSRDEAPIRWPRSGSASAEGLPTMSHNVSNLPQTNPLTDDAQGANAIEVAAMLGDSVVDVKHCS